MRQFEAAGEKCSYFIYFFLRSGVCGVMTVEAAGSEITRCLAVTKVQDMTSLWAVLCQTPQLTLFE